MKEEESREELASGRWGQILEGFSLPGKALFSVVNLKNLDSALLWNKEIFHWRLSQSYSDTHQIEGIQN